MKEMSPEQEELYHNLRSEISYLYNLPSREFAANINKYQAKMNELDTLIKQIQKG